MKKALFLLCCLALAGCSTNRQITETETETTEPRQRTEVTLALYPVGNLGNVSAFPAIVSAFNNSQNNIKVNVDYLTYADGDDKVEERISSGNPYDMVFEGPERLVANWGQRGLMVSLDDLWQEYSYGVQQSVRDACGSYEYPVCMTAHCMAVNKDRLEEVGALKFIDDETRSWSTEDFIETLKLLGEEESISVYCASQGGDQGTRMLVTNLYGGLFANKEHTEYLVNSIENVKALTALSSAEGVVFRDDVDGAIALSNFCKGETSITACWNVGQEIAHAEADDVNFDIYPVCFPTEDGSPSKLDGGIWGFGVFNTGDEKVNACKEFIRYVTHNKDVYKKVVTLSTFWPTLELEDIYVNDIIMNEYGRFTEYMGDYYQVTDNWTKARQAWWQMLQKVGDGENIDACVAWFQQEVEE